MPEKRELRSILATDCGSTTTKAILIVLGEDGYRLATRGEAPTTVEAPAEDVTRGVLNAIREVEELSGRKILDGERILSPEGPDGSGVDVYVSTSSAGGGLQMMVAGVVKQMTGESAARAALGAGAIVMDVIATNDGRRPHERIERIRQLRPDMILLSGGTDGGTVEKVVEIAELIAAARPSARLGAQYQLPIIYAGNQDARANVRSLLEAKSALTVVDNLRPVLERENLGPARDAIHELFMEHVMAHAPGYKKLMNWTHAPIMPTPGAVGLIMQRIAHIENISVVGVDIGGATTDVFSVWQIGEGGERREVFNRTVSANLGMSYSVSNVFAEAGIENVLRWVPFSIEERDLRNRIRNKMIRPTTIPQSLTELMVEQAIAREALRLAFVQHAELAVGLKGVQQSRTIADTFKQSGSGQTLVDLLKLDVLVGSGGVLSHAPRRSQAAMMLVDAFLPEGVTRIAVDSIFMMPQLGVLSAVEDPAIAESALKAAVEVFHRDCLIRLGTCIAPVGPGKTGKPCLSIEVLPDDGAPIRESFAFGDVAVFPLPWAGRKAKAVLKPARGFDVGAGPGRDLETEVEGGVVGLIVDCRGRRPFPIPENPAERAAWLSRWTTALGAYPKLED